MNGDGDNRLPTADDLKRLSDHLPLLIPDYALEIIRNMSAIPLTSQRWDMIRRQRNALRDNKDYLYIGLFDFHVGLLYLRQANYVEASDHFAEALHRWSLVPQRIFACLALFALGVTYAHNRLYGDAATICAQVRERVARITKEENPPSLSMLIEQRKRTRACLQDLARCLDKVENHLEHKEREAMDTPPPTIHNQPAESDRPFQSNRPNTPISRSFKIVRKSEDFLLPCPCLNVGDILTVDPHPNNSTQHRLCVIQGNVAGSIIVQPDKPEQDEINKIFHLGRLLEDNDDGHVTVRTTRHGQPLYLGMYAVHGTVISCCHNV
jgi:hypothetical protein